MYHRENPLVFLFSVCLAVHYERTWEHHSDLYSRHVLLLLIRCLLLTRASHPLGERCVVLSVVSPYNVGDMVGTTGRGTS